jgi:peptidase E
MCALRQKQIIAMGGGGCLEEPDNPALDRYVLQQSGKPEPAVCFLTPCDRVEALLRFRYTFDRLPCQPSHLSLFSPPTADLEGFILEKDVVYVGGGNSKSMLALWREWELDRILRRAYENGVVLAGVCAGSLVWFEMGVTDSVPGPLTALRCLGFINGSNCPHYDGEAERRPSYHRLLREGQLMEGYATDIGVALHFIGDTLAHVISSRPTAMAYRVALESGEVVERPMKPQSLV